jgi:hypothetical protein
MTIAFPTGGFLAMPPRGRAWVWAVFGLALPALLSPLLFWPPLPNLPKGLCGSFVAVASHPRSWAAGATLLGVLGAKRWAESSLQLVCVACIVTLAWVSGCDTVDRMWRLFASHR